MLWTCVKSLTKYCTNIPTMSNILITSKYRPIKKILVQMACQNSSLNPSLCKQWRIWMYSPLELTNQIYKSSDKLLDDSDSRPTYDFRYEISVLFYFVLFVDFRVPNDFNTNYANKMLMLSLTLAHAQTLTITHKSVSKQHNYIIILQLE